jgi:hypothetical protein
MKTACLTLLALLGACDPADLPAGWEDAETLDDFSWEESDSGGGGCDDTACEATMSARAAAPGLRVTGEDLPFVGAEPVEGFYRRNGGQVDVLVQPVDMNPDWDSCIDVIRIEAGIPEDPPATVTLYQRSHHGQGEPNDPVLVGSVGVAR